MSHTPQPWSADENWKDQPAIVSPDGKIVALFYGPAAAGVRDLFLSRINAFDPLVEALENAYEVMERLGDILNGHDMVEKEDEEWATPRWEKVRAALKMAGRENDSQAR